jgi:4-amino-4-deoxy-L-arabinose transferase-like glycosyltransferase
MVLAGFFKVFGFDIIQMRFPGLFFGFAFILTGGHMLKQAGVRPFFRNCFVVLLLFDPIFLQNIHSGRMDSQALFLAGLGSLFLLQGVRNGKILPYVWAGLCLGAAALTTPRVAVNMVGAGFTAMLVFISRDGNSGSG